MNDKQPTHRLFSAPLTGIILSLLAAGLALAAGDAAATNKWAWGTNVGWINFAPTNGGVTVFDDHLEGYAWGENIGWIRLGAYTGGAPHTYANADQTTYGVNNDGAGKLSGYAWGTNVGWINFAPANGGVTINPATGAFDGYAWGENTGWIHFQNGTPAYKVTTTWRQAVSLAVNTSGTGSGSISLNPPGGTYSYGTVVALTATADAGSTFTGWSGACSDSGACSVTMDGAKSVTATFTLNSYLLTTATAGTGSGSVDLDPAGGTYSHGTVVTVTATPATGSTFTGWSGACSDSGACSVTMDGAKIGHRHLHAQQLSAHHSHRRHGQRLVELNPRAARTATARLSS